MARKAPGKHYREGISLVEAFKKLRGAQKQEVVPSPIEVDETYLGGVAANKHANKKTQHGMSRKHLQRSVNEFAGRHNFCEQDTIDQIAFIARN